MADSTPIVAAPASRRRPAVVLVTVLLPFGAGYFFANLLRTVNAVIAPDLAREFGLTAADLGLLTSAYLIAFAAPQLPIGFALDRLGPRRVQSALLLVAAGGVLLFTFADGLAWLTAARAAMGLGMAGCFMAALKANAQWWPPERLPMVNGITAALGMFGSLSSTVPVEFVLPALGWRGLFDALAAATLALGVLVFVATPDRRSAAPPMAGLGAQLRELGAICRSRFFWRFGILAVIHTGTYLAYQSLWTGPWLRDVAGLDRVGVANGLMAFSGGMFVGSLTFGAVADRLQRLGVTPTAVMGVGVGLSIGIQALIALEVVAYPITMFFLFGLFCSSWFIVFTLFGQHFPTAVFGRVTTLLNSLIFAGAFLAQSGIGLIINRWPAFASGQYPPAAHRTAFLVVIALEVCAYAWVFLPRPRRGHRRDLDAPDIRL